MNKILIANGSVAYFDIMGYESINTRNEIKEVAKIILDHLDGIPASIRDIRKKYFLSIGLDEHADRFAKSISSILLSDSVLLTEKEPMKGWGAREKLLNWLFFLHACYMLMNKMLDGNLLLRGAIGYGRYFRKGNCFAGKPIIDSIRLAESLDLAGCVFVPNAWDEVEKVIAAEGLGLVADFIRSITFKYEVPLKSCASERSFKSHVMIGFGTKDNLEQKVRQAFTSYNREITEKVRPKIDNTVLMIQSFLKCKCTS